MPEEVNRVVTDRLADLLLTPSRDGDRNLAVEGIPAGRIQFVGNVMVDTLLHLEPKAAALRMPKALGLEPGRFAFVTLHRPSNVDDSAVLRELVLALDELASLVPVCFAAHPRTRQRLTQFGLQPSGGVRVMEPLGYLETIGLIREAALVLTDSGGLQEETTVVGVPCSGGGKNHRRDRPPNERRYPIGGGSVMPTSCRSRRAEMLWALPSGW